MANRAVEDGEATYLERRTARSILLAAQEKLEKLSPWTVDSLGPRLAQLDVGSLTEEALPALVSELLIFNYVAQLPTARTYFDEILKGAHVELEDSQQKYNLWRRLPGVRPRISSHQADGQQYGLSGPLFPELLFGARIRPTCGSQIVIGITWFQLERHPWGVSAGNVAGHSVDFLRHWFTGRNVGPNGLTGRTEQNPIVIRPGESLSAAPREQKSSRSTGRPSRNRR